MYVICITHILCISYIIFLCVYGFVLVFFSIVVLKSLGKQQLAEERVYFGLSWQRSRGRLGVRHGCHGGQSRKLMGHMSSSYWKLRLNSK